MTEKRNYEQRLKDWEKARFGPAPGPDLKPFPPSLIEKVAMQDGTKLYTEIFLPAMVDKAFPTILIRSPYPFSRPSRNENMAIPRYLESGYVIVFQLTRGQGQSEGIFHEHSDDADDGYDCIAWLAQQSWCDGNIGMQGPSYLGSSQLMAARTKPPALKCIMPTAFVGNFTRSFPFSNGVPNKGPYMQWYQITDAEQHSDMDLAHCDMNALNHQKWGPALRKRPLIDAADDVLTGDKLKSYQDTISNPLDDAFWENINFTDEQLAELDIPMFFTDGWYDMTVGPIDFFSRLERIHGQGRGPDRYLLVGPWNHFQTYAPSRLGDFDGDRKLPDNGAVDLVTQRLAFFDRYLKGDDTAKVQENRVCVYIAGAENSNANVWKHFSTFPARVTKQKRLYLHSQGDARSFPSDGVLNWELPSYEPVDQYTYDPDLPTSSLVETSKDRREVEVRSDVLTYTSEPLSSPLTILGDIKLMLHAASDGVDTDWFAILTEVYPDGQSKSFHYAPPAFRARYREGFDKEVLLTPNKPEEYCIPMGPAGHQIAVGHRLRLSIFSAAFPEYEPNSNTGNEVATDTEMRIAKQTIYHDALRSSHLVLPVIWLE